MNVVQYNVYNMMYIPYIAIGFQLTTSDMALNILFLGLLKFILEALQLT